MPDAAQPSDAEFQPIRCHDCGYVLIGLPAGRCPECARPFDPADPASWTRRPPFVRWKYWLPGVLFAFVGGLLVLAILARTGDVGTTVTLGAPFCIGIILGYATRLRVLGLTLATICVLVGIFAALVALNLAGLLCTFMSLLILGPPALVGGMCGYFLRQHLKRTRYSQGAYLPSLALLLLALGGGLIEARFLRPCPPTEVVTTRVLNLSPAEAWERMRLYESIPGEPPFLLQLGPRPLGKTEPDPADPSAMICMYRRGAVKKRITASVPEQRFAFDVLEHHMGEERSVRLLDGSFVFERLGERRTRVALTTHYIPRLRPRFCWRPAEAAVLRSLHNFILDGFEDEQHWRKRHLDVARGEHAR